ncbi:hypothetical protein BDY19DRAFT_991048 [Irpex rosettiformis]|uniref:Uncharacterized protein n=1 Tax=Irpex rosettiformis TaxID=378272 RepID=A0ACB8UDT6_9APHY|nr:hypothetical protein BDY19DRAFT_991048 [Irpex rosettiformis]
MSATEKTKRPDAKMEWKFPVHSALSDEKWSGDSIERMLRSVYTANPVLLNQPDERGVRPITIAAIKEKSEAIMVMLEVAGPKLAQGEDVLGLEHCDDKQETAISHNLALLRKSQRYLIHEMLDNACKTLREGYINNKLPKCVCGKCTEGWLSPRMRFRLREIAHEAYTTMLCRLDDFTDNDEPLDAEAASDDPFLSFIPPHIVAQGIRRQFYLGYRAAFHIIRTMIGIPEATPTASKLRVDFVQGAHDGKYNYAAVEHFIERGGSVKYALDYVVHQALWTSPMPLGDGSFDQKWNATLPYPDPRDVTLSKVERQAQSSPAGKSPRIGSSPLQRAQQVQSSPNLTEAQGNTSTPRPQGRRRSSSFKDMIFGKRERASWLIQINEDDCLNHALQWTLKDEWEESGKVQCPLNTQFRGVRYLLGLHTPPKWNTDDVEVGAHTVQKDGQLKRARARSFQ